jgi:hypothetical protein
MWWLLLNCTLFSIQDIGTKGRRAILTAMEDLPAIGTRLHLASLATNQAPITES